MPDLPAIVKRAASFAWAFWTTARASVEYVAGRIGEDEWRTRVGIARFTVGSEVPDIDDLGEGSNHD
jgi:hypothetical protein